MGVHIDVFFEKGRFIFIVIWVVANKCCRQRQGYGGVIPEEDFRKNESIFHNFLVHFHFPVCVNYTGTGPILRRVKKFS